MEALSFGLTLSKSTLLKKRGGAEIYRMEGEAFYQEEGGAAIYRMEGEAFYQERGRAAI